ncbi:unnamed protein product, partial [Iphiclides podalirius]
MENALIQSKVKLLFEKILEPNYVMDNYYADNLFIKINGTDPEVQFFKSLPFLADQIVEALCRFETYHNTVKVFLIRLLAVVCDREVNFAKIFSRKCEMMVQAFSQINSPAMNSSLRVAYLDVALSLVNHSTGVCWLYDSDVWKQILLLCNEKRTVFVLRKTYKFASTFIWELNRFSDETKVKTVLQYIMRPVLETDYLTIDTMTSENEDQIGKTVEPMLQMLLSIVSNMEEIKKESSLLTEILIKESKIISHCYVLLDKLRREDMTLLLTKILFSMSVAKVINKQPIANSNTYKRDAFVELGCIYLNIVRYLIQRRCPTLVFDFCNACSAIWTLAWHDKPPAIWMVEDKRVELHNQIVVLILVPSMVYATLGKPKSLLSNDKVDEYLLRLMNSLSEHTARAAYALRDLTLQLDTLSITLQSVKRLSCWRKRFSIEQANMVFQAMFYVLKEYEPAGTNDDETSSEVLPFEDTQERTLVMTHVLETLLMLVQTPNLSCKFVMTALNVIAVTVKKFLPPNLSLLMDSRPGSSMHELGKLIYMKLHDYDWEVRDSALELLLVCTEISFIKFPPFQCQITTNNLINVATTMALNDHEFYVRATALRCLEAATKVTAIWDQLRASFPNINEMIMSVLLENPEGIVRKEACNVLCEVYQNAKISPALKKSLYECMLSAALNDFHWEVQLSALRFWKIVIQQTLHAQGMLDGTFPPVTFSKESRKIVCLNDVEIQKRLQKTLEELASVGCLTVLVKLLQDDSEVDIMESALQISTDLCDILDRYRVADTLKPTEGEPSSVEQLDCRIKLRDRSGVEPSVLERQAATEADNVIEGILNVDDVNLLTKMYERQLRLQTESQPEEAQSKGTQLLKFATPYLFVTFMKSRDFKAVIDQKRNWKDGIKSLSSLLDDVLGIYEFDEDVNSLDCY